MNPLPMSRGISELAVRVWVMALIVVGSLTLAHQAMSLERIQLEPTGIGRPSDRMGQSVALLGDTAVVGAPQSQVINGVNSGTVNVYRLQNGVWQTEAMLSPANLASNLAFGSAVALGPDLLAVAGSSSLYTFERSGTAWQQVDQRDAIGFGQTQIGMSGSTVVIGGTILVRSGNGWEEQSVLVPDDPSEYFMAATIDGDFVVAATQRSQFGGPLWTAVYFYSRLGSTWTRERRVPLSSLATVYLAISGHTALVSIPNDPSPSVTSVHVFDRDDAGTWVDTGTLDAGVDFTWDVPVSIDGDVALVGSHSDFTAYTFVRSGGVWSRDLHFNDPYAHCFAAVALSGSTALAGCPYSYTVSAGYGIADIFSLDSNPPPVVAQFGQGTAHAGEFFGWRAVADGNTLIATSNQGAYFYDRSSTGWTPTNAFLAPPPHLDVSSLTLDGDTAAIGYPIQQYPGGTSEVDVYLRSGGAWALQAVIPGPPPADDSRYFAASLALQGDVLVVGDFWDGGASSACHVFQRSGVVWQAGADLVPVGGAPGDYFCWSLSMSGDTLLVGAPKTNIGIDNAAGAVYVFVRSGSTWTQAAQLHAPLIATGAGFGTSVVIKGSTAVVGSNNSTNAFDSTRGEVNVYRRSGNTWSWQATLEAPVNGNAPGDFGYAVALSDAEDRILATAPYDRAHDPYAGVAFAFEFDGLQWSPSTTIYASPPFPPTMDDMFGWNASFSGEDFVIGAPLDGLGGAVYVGPTSETVFANGFETVP